MDRERVMAVLRAHEAELHRFGHEYQRADVTATWNTVKEHLPRLADATRLSAHTYLAMNPAKPGDDEIALNREGDSKDAKAQAAVRFARRVAEARGKVAAADIEAVRNTGYTDAQVVEITLTVALNFLTNLVNNVAGAK